MTSIDEVQSRAVGASRNRRAISTGRRGDKVFRGAALGSGIFVLVIMGAIAAFLIWKAIPALQANEGNFLTDTEWRANGDPPRFGIAQLAFGTIMSAFLALLMATPVAIGIALFISFYAPRKLADGLGFIVDLLAAVPSIIYGLWGLHFLVMNADPVIEFLNTYLGWFPLFAGENVGGQSIFIGSVVLAIMILPIVSSISREVFLQVPTPHIEAAQALGATRWETIRLSVLPYGRSGVISAMMLGLGRALGETVAIALVLSTVAGINWHILEPGGNTFAANIVRTFGESGDIGRSALIASGLVLFIITMIVNMAARAVVSRRKEFTE
ncbi:phosphate ABC transporter membrane protein 1 (PhoT family) [Actinocorallia herbida]|uniref:Phosphate transport system permease protein n=1 Tax=Actinocorallia herbida TaxID=58109 RepID=A0A3N1DC33_9ACTN|nr:phosphate ABC transporter membrane protein 1 (PhoT family) [Actinocorallia herbida]